jgi:hypothetical protein
MSGYSPGNWNFHNLYRNRIDLIRYRSLIECRSNEKDSADEWLCIWFESLVRSRSKHFHLEPNPRNDLDRSQWRRIVVLHGTECHAAKWAIMDSIEMTQSASNQGVLGWDSMQSKDMHWKDKNNHDVTIAKREKGKAGRKTMWKQSEKVYSVVDNE